ncbi:MAG: hypothetical protein ACE5GZ_14490 [Gammaproteobacteria bacterium]
MIKQISIFFIVAICLVSCSGMSTKKRLETFEESIKQYNIALRWALYTKVEDFHIKRNGERMRVDRDALKNIRITGYSVQEKTINEDLTEAVVEGEINYYNKEYGTLKKMAYTYKWWYEPESKRWFIESEFPEFK